MVMLGPPSSNFKALKRLLDAQPQETTARHGKLLPAMADKSRWIIFMQATVSAHLNARDAMDFEIARGSKKLELGSRIMCGEFMDCMDFMDFMDCMSWTSWTSWAARPTPDLPLLFPISG